MTEYLVTDATTLAKTWTTGTGITDALRRHENALRERKGISLLGSRALAFHDGSGAIINSGIGNSFIRGRREYVMREGGPMTRYIVHPISDEHCDSLTRSKVILRTNDLAAAKYASRCCGYPYGGGILDTMTGQIDVGFGFGVPCPDFSEG